MLRVSVLDEHWEAAALAAVRQNRAADPQAWADYLAEADALAAADAPVTDGWHRA